MSRRAPRWGAIHEGRVAALTCLLALALTACETSPPGDASNGASNAAADAAEADGSPGLDGATAPDSSATTADSGGADAQGGGGDAADAAVAKPDSGSADAGNTDADNTDAGSTDAGGGDSAGGGADGGAGTPNAGAAASYSCKGTPSCSLYQQPGGMSSCSKDPGCKASGYKCAPANPNAAGVCASQKNNKAGCAQAAAAGAACKWGSKGCYLLNWCHMHKSAGACTGEKKLACAWQPTTCVGLSALVKCSKAKTKADCAKGAAFGCDWNNCQPTNGGKEICDGIDNDCDGVTDNATVSDGKGGSAAICDDGDACNGAEVCVKGTCAAGKPLTCASKACHDATCDKAKGCVYTANTASCDDGKPCTINDACAGGVCTGSTKPCDDNNACTVDACDTKTGKCTTTGKTMCKDGSLCTTDGCDPKKGCTTKAVNCDDGNSCTDDGCDPKKGCTKKANSKMCDDKNPCTTSDVCINAACAGKAKCDDGKACTLDSCDAKTGACKNAAIAGCKACTKASQCDDGKPCTQDSCAGGACKSVPINNCVPPTDYELLSLSGTPTAPVPLGAKLTPSVVVQNLGKVVGGTAPLLQLWLSKTATLNPVASSADSMLLASASWSSGKTPLGAGAVTKRTWKPQAFLPNSFSSAYKKPQAMNYICARVYWKGEKNVSNNLKCKPFAAIKRAWQPTTIDSATLPLTMSYGKHYSVVTFKAKNTGNVSIVSTVKVAVYASKDGAFSAKSDLWIASGSVALSNAGQPWLKGTVRGATANLKLTITTAAQVKALKAGKSWWCLVPTTDGKQPAGPGACKQLTVTSKPDLRVASNTLTPGGLTWAQSHRCQLAIEHAKLPVAPVAVRCFISATGKLADATWQQTFQSAPLPIIGTYTTKTATSVAGPVKPFVAVPLGTTKICAEVNYDKAQPDANPANNLHCRSVTITGYDLIPYAKATRLWPVVANNALTVGKAYGTQLTVVNRGPAGYTAPGGWKGMASKYTVHLSKDAKLSPDDKLLSSRTVTIKTLAGNQKGAVGDFGQVTVPAGTAKGVYYLIWNVNSDGLVKEPRFNNTRAIKISVK